MTLTTAPLPTPRLAGYQGPGWPGWRWLQGFHRGWLRPQAVSACPASIDTPRRTARNLRHGFPTERSRVRFSALRIAEQIQSNPPPPRLTSRPPPLSRSRSRNGKAGYVYKLGLRNGKANIDEYAPIYTPSEFKTDGDKYEGDLKLAVGAVLGVIGTGALAILATSAL